MTKYYLRIPIKLGKLPKDAQIRVEDNKNNKRTTIIIEDSDIDDTDTIIIEECIKPENCTVTTVAIEVEAVDA